MEKNKWHQEKGPEHASFLSERESILFLRIHFQKAVYMCMWELNLLFEFFPWHLSRTKH